MRMRLGVMLSFSGGFESSKLLIPRLEAAGLDTVWMPEAYGFDAPTHMGYLAAITQRVDIASGILNIYSRTPSALAQTAAGLDSLSGGRAILGIGTSGPQVVEGFHGVAFDRPVQRTREVIEICRKMWERTAPLTHDGLYRLPLPASEGTGQGKPLKLLGRLVRHHIPIFVAALGPKNVALTAELADGWLPTLFWPERAADVWGDDLAAGRARREPGLGPLRTCVGATVTVTDDPSRVRTVLDRARPHVALYVGGMGSREHNFYNRLFQRYGLVEEARGIQDTFLAGDPETAAALVPETFLSQTNLVGDERHVRSRLEAYAAAGVTDLNLTLAGADQPALLSRLRDWVDRM